MKKDLLSIGFMHGHNSSASLMINDRIVAAISEERFTRKKNSTDFPINSINFLIKEYGLNRKKIKFTHPSFIIPFSDENEIKKYNNFGQWKVVNNSNNLENNTSTSLLLVKNYDDEERLL